MPDGYTLHKLAANDLGLMYGLLQTFGEVFKESETYVGKRPSPDYMRRLLGSDYFIAIVTMKGEAVVVASQRTS